MKNVLIILAILPCLLCCCQRRQQPETPAHSVMTTRPIRNGGESTKRFTGIVKEAMEINLGFKTPGQIKRIAVKEGGYVRRGQLIATLDNADYKLGVDALQAQYDQLANETKRLGILYKDKSIPANDYEKALAGLKQVRIQLQANKNKLSYTRLYAPTAGYVDKVNFDEAEMVDAGTPVITLLDTSGKEVEADIPADLYLDNENIISVACRHPYGGGPLPMRITSITPKADATQLYKMRLAFANEPGKQLTGGMNICIELRMAAPGSDGTFTVPLHSVFQENGKTYVWTVGKSSAVNKREVTVSGTDASGNAVVTSGLNGGEHIVKAGVNALHEGEKVKIIDEGSKTNVGGLL